MSFSFFNETVFAWGWCISNLVIALNYHVILISLTKRKEFVGPSLYLLFIAFFSYFYFIVHGEDNLALFLRYANLVIGLFLIGIGFYGWKKKILSPVYSLFSILLLLPYSLGHNLIKLFLDTTYYDTLPTGLIIICILNMILFALHMAYQFHQMDQQRNKYQNSTHAKTEFLANMSHEIRTPLNAIIGMGELLENAKLNGDQKKYLNVLRSASENLMSLLNDTLDLSKIEAGKIELEKVFFSPGILIRDTVKFLSPAAKKKNIDLKYKIEENLPDCEGDPTKIRQILVNLISNAIKFTPQGFIEVNADLCKQDVLAYMQGRQESNHGQASCLLLSIKDTGLGIPEEKWSAIFEAFSQADSGITRRFGGSGLGLAITRHLLGLMGGRIWVESLEKQGSTFFCIIPLKFVSHEVSQTKERSVMREKERPKTTRACNILVVEDNIDNQLLLQAYFKKSNHKLEIANNGQNAVDAITKKMKEFDLIFMDIQMPVKDGLTATREIRAWEEPQLRLNRRKKVPIYALTAHAFQEEVLNSKAAGCDGHISKPIRKEKLFDLIASHCE